MRQIDFDDNDIPFWLIIYAMITVIASIFAPKNTPESVKISILVSGQTALGGAAGMSRAGKGKEITNKIDNVDRLVEQPDLEERQHYLSSDNNNFYK